MSAKILFIGHGIFCDGLTRLIGEVPNVEIIGAVESCANARPIIEETPPNILIVDHAHIDPKCESLTDLLENGPDSIKVIYLSLTENKMVVHNRQQLSDVTLPILIQALNSTNPGDCE